MTLRQKWISLGWAGSVAVAMNLWDARDYVILLRGFRGVAWAVAPLLASLAAGWIAGGQSDNWARTRWRELAYLWLLVEGAVWLGIAYFRDWTGLFYGCLIFLVLTLALIRPILKPGPIPASIAHTLALVLALLPALDQVLYRPVHTRELPPGAVALPVARRGEPAFLDVSNAPRFYSFAAARGDPSSFALWWQVSMAAMRQLIHDISEPAINFSLSIRLRPGSVGRFFDSTIPINSRGFRGPEIASKKGKRFRIVALGESTTFGLTMRPGDKPWPELLTAMIRDRLKPDRPVEVINAGVPGWDLEDNDRRLVTDILPLHPDLIISYHGYNGFLMIDGSFPHPWGPPPPAFPSRPLRLAADLEYRFMLRAFLRAQIPVAPRDPEPIVPLRTRYAAAYRRLIAFAATNHIQLALADFSMAINDHSNARQVDFYRACGWGSLCVRHHANAIHTTIVRELAAQNPDVIFVDTQAGLDGNPEDFIDLVHLTQHGRDRLAENMFRGLRAALEHDLPTPAGQ